MLTVFCSRRNKSCVELKVGPNGMFLAVGIAGSLPTRIPVHIEPEGLYDLSDSTLDRFHKERRSASLLFFNSEKIPESWTFSFDLSETMVSLSVNEFFRNERSRDVEILTNHRLRLTEVKSLINPIYDYFRGETWTLPKRWSSS